MYLVTSKYLEHMVCYVDEIGDMNLPQSGPKATLSSLGFMQRFGYLLLHPSTCSKLFNILTRLNCMMPLKVLVRLVAKVSVGANTITHFTLFQS
jgi:hypothetical protein